MYIEGERARAFSRTVDDVRSSAGVHRSGSGSTSGEEAFSLYLFLFALAAKTRHTRSLGSRSLESRARSARFSLSFVFSLSPHGRRFVKRLLAMM